jgi:hypothetical protein
MVYFVLSRHGYDQLVTSSDPPQSPLWVNGGVLAAEELTQLRGRGFDVTDFHHSINPRDIGAVEEAVDTIRLHHPGQVVWVEYGYAA